MACFGRQVCVATLVPMKGGRAFLLACLPELSCQVGGENGRPLPSLLDRPLDLVGPEPHARTVRAMTQTRDRNRQ
eukprot:10074714-Karenia_brevis.AAC.1